MFARWVELAGGRMRVKKKETPAAAAAVAAAAAAAATQPPVESKGPPPAGAEFDNIWPLQLVDMKVTHLCPQEVTAGVLFSVILIPYSGLQPPPTHPPTHPVLVVHSWLTCCSSDAPPPNYPPPPPHTHTHTHTAGQRPSPTHLLRTSPAPPGFMHTPTSHSACIVAPQGPTACTAC